jgi:hypothetical protein
MNQIAGIALGAFISLASLWAGSFFMHWLGWGHWAHFPTFITCGLMAGLGVVIAVRHINF